MNPDSLVTLDLTVADYEDLLDLLRICADECSKCSEFDDLASDFRYYCELLESNTR